MSFPKFDLTLFPEMMNLKFPDPSNPDARLGPARCCLRPALTTKFQHGFYVIMNYTIDDEQLHDVRCYTFCCYKMIMSMKRIISHLRKTDFYVELKDDHVNETHHFPILILLYSVP